mgnify:CR=1 FL=1
MCSNPIAGTVAVALVGGYFAYRYMVYCSYCKKEVELAKVKADVEKEKIKAEVEKAKIEADLQKKYAKVRMELKKRSK